MFDPSPVVPETGLIVADAAAGVVVAQLEVQGATASPAAATDLSALNMALLPYGIVVTDARLGHVTGNDDGTWNGDLTLWIQTGVRGGLGSPFGILLILGSLIGGYFAFKEPLSEIQKGVASGLKGMGTAIRLLVPLSAGALAWWVASKTTPSKKLPAVIGVGTALATFLAGGGFGSAAEEGGTTSTKPMPPEYILPGMPLMNEAEWEAWAQKMIKEGNSSVFSAIKDRVGFSLSDPYEIQKKQDLAKAQALFLAEKEQLGRDEWMAKQQKNLDDVLATGTLDEIRAYRVTVETKLAQVREDKVSVGMPSGELLTEEMMWTTQLGEIDGVLASHGILTVEQMMVVQERIALVHKQIEDIRRIFHWMDV